MWSRVEQRVQVKTAADQVVENEPISATEKTATVERLRRRFRNEKELIRAEVERRRQEARPARLRHDERSVSADPSTFVRDVIAARRQIASLTGADVQGALAWARIVRAALRGESNDLQAQLIRQAVENARTVPARLSALQSKPPKPGK